MVVALTTRWRAALVVTLLAFLVVTFYPADLPGLFGPRDFAWASWCYAFGVPVLAVALATGRPLRVGLLWPLGAYVAWIAVTAPFGVDMVNSLRQLTMLAGIVLAAIAVGWLVQLDERATTWLLVGSVLTLNVLQLLAFMHHVDEGLAQRITTYLLPRGWSGYPELSLLVALQFVVLLSALLCWHALVARVALIVLIAVTVVEGMLLYGRSAWVAMAVVTCVLPLLARVHRRALVPLAGTAAVVGALVVCLAMLNPSFRQLGLGVVTGKFGGAGVTEGGVTLNVADFDRRLGLWMKTSRMIGDHWQTGVGLGNFRSVFERDYHSEYEDDGRKGVHAHNAFLQQTAELGVLGGVLFALVWAAGFIGALRRPAGFGRTALLGALLVVFVMSLSDYYSYGLDGARGRLTFVIWMVLVMATSGAPLVSGLMKSSDGQLGPLTP